MPNPHPRPWHRGSVYGDGPRVPLCRERRAVWKARLTLFRRARRLTPLFEDIGLALLRRLGTDGRLDPAQRTVAEDVGCDERSVRRALAALKACGLVLWVNRLCGRAVQTSNAYALTTGAKPPIFTGGQFVRRTPKDRFSYVHQTLPQVSPEAQREARTALERRAAAVRERLLLRRAVPR